jgi:hypothetical protein
MHTPATATAPTAPATSAAKPQTAPGTPAAGARPASRAADVAHDDRGAIEYASWLLLLRQLGA